MDLQTFLVFSISQAGVAGELAASSPQASASSEQLANHKRMDSCSEGAGRGQVELPNVPSRKT